MNQELELDQYHIILNVLSDLSNKIHVLHFLKYFFFQRCHIKSPIQSTVYMVGGENQPDSVSV